MAKEKQKDFTGWANVPPAFEQEVTGKGPLQEKLTEAIDEPIELEALSEPPQESSTRVEELSPQAPVEVDVQKLIQQACIAAYERGKQEAQLMEKSTVTQSIEAGARQQLELQDPHIAQTLLMQAERVGGSVAQVIAGIIKQLGDQGNLGDFSLTPQWQERVHEAGQQLPGSTFRTTQTAACQQCGHAFKPSHYGQTYCCTPCGKIAAGYHDGELPHSDECTTAAGKMLNAMSRSKPKSTEAQA